MTHLDPNRLDLDLAGPIRAALRALPLPLRVPVGLLGVWTCLSSFARHLSPPEPGQPVLAFWFTLLLFAAAVILKELIRPKPRIEGQRPAGLGDFNFPTTTEGRPVPLLFGRCVVEGPNVVWYGDFRQDAITEKVKTGLWSSTRITKGFKYFVGIQMAFCRGPSVTLKKVWVGDVEVFSGTVSTDTTFDIDKPDLFGGDELGTGGIQATCDWFTGSTTQAVSPYLNRVGIQRITSAITPTAPRYTGTCYLIAREKGAAAASARGAYIGNSTTIKPWKFEMERFPAIFSGQSAGQNVIGGADCNPMNVIYEALTNVEWGLGFPAADIDVGSSGSFKSASDTLITEANGFAMLLDSTREAIDLIREVEKQIDGVVFMDVATGKWKVKLARADYAIGSVPQVNDTNSEVKSYSKGSWEDTTNQISVQYDKRADDYKKSFALAQDMANAMIQGAGTVLTGAVVSAQSAYPGVKTAALANNIAWRDLRTQSYPLARATFLLDRSFWDLTPAAVFAWTSTQFGFTQLPMRVISINYGRLQDNVIEVEAVQDVFKFAAASYGNPPSTQWTPPVTTLVAFPSADQLALEAPRGIIVRDPNYAGDSTISKVLCAARRQGTEAAFRIKQRNSSGAPSGSFSDAGDVVSFMRIGKLQSALNTGTAIPTATITILPDPDAQSALETVFDDTRTLSDLGVDLAHLILVNNELMLVRSAANNGANVDLQNVYRGVLDTVQGEHAANDRVYLVFVGAGLTDTTFPTTNNVDVELRMRSADTVFAGAVTAISLTMAKRAIRPYPPSTCFSQGSATPFNTPNLEGQGGPGLNDFRFDVSWRRRRYDTGDEVNELLADQSVSASTEYRVRIFVAPSGINQEVVTSAFATGTGPVAVDRELIINKAAAGTEIRIQIEVRHDIGTEVDLGSRSNFFFDVVPTSTLTGQFYFGGGLRANDNSNSYTAVATGTFTLNIGGAYVTSNVQVSINGGAYATVILAGLTTGTFSANSSDTIRVRHTVNETPSPNFIELKNPSGTAVAYGCFTN